ncbi:MAG: hypothetical protein BJ554DRAFT_3998 [Olpidium bornovanus]|uniref:Uncharacterized protein n=1 Tax=Olpidium bornovanus TaxID=278681 RepID=A0A8H7ZNC0_9FUNG|nr:MAG: hypothetical protein BJ554DRAFT_3998 [Olpidium bornovanus]
MRRRPRFLTHLKRWIRDALGSHLRFLRIVLFASKSLVSTVSSCLKPIGSPCPAPRLPIGASPLYRRMESFSRPCLCNSDHLCVERLSTRRTFTPVCIICLGNTTAMRTRQTKKNKKKNKQRGIQVAPIGPDTRNAHRLRSDGPGR